ncbi:hypothetical protein SBV1_1690001 [Verrucomicrobia bacterium]|nr:hypothetical protein SBV1_1690001 [Verrucomicrobiota bacterium]
MSVEALMIPSRHDPVLGGSTRASEPRGIEVGGRFEPSRRPDAPEIKLNQTKSGLEAHLLRPEAPEITFPWVSDTRLAGTLAL